MEAHAQPGLDEGLQHVLVQEVAEAVQTRVQKLLAVR